MAEKLTQLKDQIHGALVDRVVEDFVDIVTPLKQFSEATLAPEVYGGCCTGGGGRAGRWGPFKGEIRNSLCVECEIGHNGEAKERGVAVNWQIFPLLLDLGRLLARLSF